MNLVQLSYELLNKSSVKIDIANIFLVTLLLFDYLWLQQQKLLVSHFKLEVFAHKIAQICPYADLHRERHCSNSVVINNQVLLNQ